MPGKGNISPLIAPSNTAGAGAPARRKPAMGHFPNGTAPTRRLPRSARPVSRQREWRRNLCATSLDPCQAARTLTHSRSRADIRARGP
jgi:hypothetical protein